MEKLGLQMWVCLLFRGYPEAKSWGTSFHFVLKFHLLIF